MVELSWKGHGINEAAFDKKTKKMVVKINKAFFRPTEVNYLFGTQKANKTLKWAPKTDLNKLIKIMCDYELSKYV